MFTKPNTLTGIQKKAESALSLFRKAIQDLEAASTEATELEKQNQEKINALVDENVALTTLVADNTKVTENIKSLIGA